MGEDLETGECSAWGMVNALIPQDRCSLQSCYLHVLPPASLLHVPHLWTGRPSFCVPLCRKFSQSSLPSQFH